MTTEMELVVGCDGGVRCIYDEALDLRQIGEVADHPGEPRRARC